MRKKLVIAAILLPMVLVASGVALVCLYEAAHAVPEFYRRAVDRPLAEQEGPRDQFVAQAAALASDLHRSGRWQTLFTDEQINAWLALELATNYPQLLPSELREPRVAFHDHEATIACRYHNGEASAVVSLSVDVSLHDPHVLALRIRRARAGALPVPLAQVLDGISHAARELNLRIEWRKTHGDPVALITLPKPRSGQGDAVRLNSIELKGGELFVAGFVGPNDGAAPSDAPKDRKPSESAEPPAEAHPLVGEAAKETRQE